MEFNVLCKMVLTVNVLFTSLTFFVKSEKSFKKCLQDVGFELQYTNRLTN